MCKDGELFSIDGNFRCIQFADRDIFVCAVVVAAAADEKVMLFCRVKQKFNAFHGIAGIIALHTADAVGEQGGKKRAEIALCQVFFSLSAKRMRPDGNAACRDDGADRLIGGDAIALSLRKVEIFFDSIGKICRKPSSDQKIG